MTVVPNTQYSLMQSGAGAALAARVPGSVCSKSGPLRVGVD
jgi:hypothetical protein